MPEKWTTLVAGQVPEALRRALEAAGATCCLGADLATAERLLGEREIDVVVTAIASEALISAAHRDAGQRHLPVIALAPASDADTRLRLLRAGCEDVVDPAAPLAELIARISGQLAQRERVDDLLAEVGRLRDLSSIDGLTQLHNHRAFKDRLTQEFRRAQRYDDSLALVMIDVDFFKKINDDFGHPVGDEVLSLIAGSLRTAVRETDFVARYGGEEFAVLLPRTNLAGALTVSERVHSEVGKLRVETRREVSVTASLGISAFPGRNINSAEALVRTADEALYRSKREGRNKISLYQASAPPGSSPPRSAT